MELTADLMTRVLGAKTPMVAKQAPMAGSDLAFFSAAAFSEGIAAPMGAKELRRWYETNPWIFAAVDQRCADVANADWVVSPIDEKLPYDHDVLDRITELMTAPNPDGANNSYGGLWHPAVIDTLCLDKGGIQILLNDDKEPAALKCLDGARVHVRAGWKTDKDGPRYVYLHEDRSDGIPMMNDELLLISAHPSSYNKDGLAPLKVLNRVLIAEYDTFKSIHILQKNRAPSAIFKMPNASKEAVETAKSLWLNELAGRSGLGFMSVPTESDLLVLGSVNLVEQGAFSFYDMLLRMIASCFRIATQNLNWLQDVNRAVAQEQSQMSDAGTIALLRLFQGLINREIVAKFQGSENIGFRYLQLGRQEALSVTAVREMAGRQVNPWSINQMLIASGQPPVRVTPVEGKPTPEQEQEQEYYDKPLIQVATGEVAPPSVAMKLPQYQGAPAVEPTPPPVSTGRPNHENMPASVVDQIATSRPARAALSARRKGTPQGDQQDAMDSLFDDIDAVFRKAQEDARKVVNGTK